MEIDELELEILGKLFSLQESVLAELCTYLSITKKGKTKRKLLKEVRASIESLTSGEDDETILESLKEIAEIVIEEDMPELEAETVAQAELTERIKEQKQQNGKVAAQNVKLAQQKQVRAIGLTDVEYKDDRSSFLRREFKISGSIGQPRETNKLNFISLVHQIEGGLAKGYSEAEVCEAVIRSISPGMALRSFLECTPDQPLSKIRKIIRSHYREKSATELYKSLSTLTQGPNEDAQSFLFRALELRQRVIFTCKEADSKISYDQNLIQNLFLHSMETGLRDESVRAKLRPFLQDTDVPDDELIGQMNIIFCEEQEKETKLGRKIQKSTARVDKITSVTPKVAGEKPNTESNKSLVATLNAVQMQLSDLKASFEKFKNDSNNVQAREKGPIRPPRECESCVAESKPENCNHCFICGDSSHFAYGCRKRNIPKNGKGVRYRRGNP